MSAISRLKAALVAAIAILSGQRVGLAEGMKLERARAVSGTLDWLVGGNDIATGALGWSAGTAQTVDAWYMPGGAWRVTDGTHSATGVSAAAPSTGGTLYLGGSSSAGAGVALSQVKVCKRAGVCR